MSSRNSIRATDLPAEFRQLVKATENPVIEMTYNEEYECSQRLYIGRSIRGALNVLEQQASRYAVRPFPSGWRCLRTNRENGTGGVLHPNLVQAEYRWGTLWLKLIDLEK